MVKGHHNTKVILAVAVVAIIIALIAAGFLLIPSVLSPTIDSSWTIVIPERASTLTTQPDYPAAIFLQGSAGAQQISTLNQANSGTFNNWGQNLVFLGGWYGVSGLKDFAPWASFQELSILQRPTSQPNIRWYQDATGNWIIETPSSQYSPPNIGYISVGYDVLLHRYIVIAIGWDKPDTYKLATLIPTLLPSISPGHYVVIKSSDGSILERG